MKAARRLAIALTALAAGFACERSPTAAPSAPTAPPQAAHTAPSPTSSTPKSTGLVPCGQSYDSVTQVIGPRGGYFAVGPHYLFVDSLALTAPVTITAVAPASGSVRWVRFHPDGLVFQSTVDGWSALLYTNYTNCGVPTSTTVQIAQVSDSLSILGYLQTYTKFKKNPSSQGPQYVVGLLLHFSNYAIAW
jgi:hypothetical protein